MDDTTLSPELLSAIHTMKVCGVDHLPVVAAYCNAIRLQETVNDFVDTKMKVKPGAIVQAMVLDTLSGRSPGGKHAKLKWYLTPGKTPVFQSAVAFDAGDFACCLNVKKNASLLFPRDYNIKPAPFF